MSAPNAARNGPLARPPRNSASSRRTPHSRSVRITRSCAGAERAVTSAVRTGASSPGGNSACISCRADRKLRNGPPDSGSRARWCSCRPNASTPCSREIRSLSSPKITASPSKAMRSWSRGALTARAGRIVAAATPCCSERRTDSGLADRNRSVPNGATYGQVGSPAVNTARTMPSPWCWIELKMRRPVSAEFRDNRMTSTCGAPGGSLRLSASSLRTTGNATPGSSTSSSSWRW